MINALNAIGSAFACIALLWLSRIFAVWLAGFDFLPDYLRMFLITGAFHIQRLAGPISDWTGADIVWAVLLPTSFIAVALVPIIVVALALRLDNN